jgi:D-alanyl-D-alanine endopeptidase (penicillin-binding protein 7)
MPKMYHSLCALITGAMLVMTPVNAASKSPEKTTVSAKKSTAKKATKQVKAKSNTKVTRSRGSIEKQAIARARRDVQIGRVNANIINLSSPGVQSSGVLILNQQSGEVMYERNADNIVPIASITKLMTAMVVLDARLPLNELISVTQGDVDTLKNTSSRLTVGTTLTRGEMLLLALMSSENRAASALSHAYPGGREAFVRKMNEKAQQLGMQSSRFYDPTGLTPSNVSTPRELSLMVKAAQRYPEIHQFTTSSEYSFTSNLSGNTMVFHNTNPLVKDSDWQIGVSKTGFINEAGRCIVMQATIDNVPVVMVLMDSNGKYTRIGDAQRVRRWLEMTRASNLKAG